MHRIIVALACLGVPVCAFAQSLELIGRFTWQTEPVNGVSAIEVADNGLSFIAISDGGWRLEGEFARDGEAISGVALTRLDPIRGMDGWPVAARRVGDWSDAEGLAIADNGSEYISFERWAHVWWFPEPGSTAEWIKDHPSFYDLGKNRQLEAMAIDPEGSVFAFSERPLDEGFPIYRLDGKTWTIDGYLEEFEGYSIVGADFDSDGRLFLLERKLQLGLWWRSQIRIVDLTSGEFTVIWTSQRDAYTNLEGISVWSDKNGPRITLVSDNNGSLAEPTEFVEFRLTQ